MSKTFIAAATAALALAAGAAGAEEARTTPSLPSLAPLGEAMNFTLPDGRRIDQLSLPDPDTDEVLATLRDVRAGNILAVRGHERALKAVLSHMPRPFERVSHPGGKLAYRGDTQADCLAFAATLTASPDGKVSFACQGNPYPTAALMLGAYYDEIEKYDQALAVLDAGLIAGPDAPLLYAERGAALSGLHRWADTLADADRGLAIAHLSDLNGAQLQRKRGLALTELGRLDEAEAAYRRSLELQPGNETAENELRYIAGLRAGRERTNSQQIPLAPH